MMLVKCKAGWATWSAVGQAAESYQDLVAKIWVVGLWLMEEAALSSQTWYCPASTILLPWEELWTPAVSLEAFYPPPTLIQLFLLPTPKATP